MYKDLRDYLSALESAGDLRHITEQVDSQSEVGAVARLACERYGPAVLFDNIKDYPGFRMLGAFETYSSEPGLPLARLNSIFGLAKDAPGSELVELLADARNLAPLDPVVVESGPVQDNIITENPLDALPVPHLHPMDGGPYVNTIGFFVFEAPDRSWVNWSVARAMKVDGNHMVGMTAPMQHIGMLRAEWEKVGKSVPFALVLGADPLTTFLAGSSVSRYGHSERSLAGALLGKPVELVKCKTNDVLVPANAEIVIEGEIHFGEAPPEGPMAEYHGYIDAIVNTMGDPIFGGYRVVAVTHRDNAIYPCVSAGKPVDEDHTITGPGLAGVALDELRTHGLPVKSCWMLPESANHLLAVTVVDDWEASWDGTSSELVAEIGKTVKALKHDGYWVQRILVTNHDIDPTSVSDLWWAYATRCRPGDGSQILEGVPIMALSPLVNSLEERMATVGRVELLNAVMKTPKAPEDIHSAAFTESYPKSVQERALALYDGGA